MTTNTIYNPTKYNEKTFFNRLNRIVGDVNTELNEIRSYVDEKLSKASISKSTSVFEETNDVIVSGETFSYIPLKTVISKSTFTNMTDDGNVMLTSSGLYRIEVITDLKGDYTNGFIELVVETGMDDDMVETVVKKHFLNESLLNCVVKSFDGNEKLKLKVSNESDKEFTIRSSLIISKIY